MNLSKFKIGDIIYKPGKASITGPIQFLGYASGLLFYTFIKIPEVYHDKTDFLTQSVPLEIGGVIVQMQKVDPNEEWFSFPFKTLQRIRKFIEKKYQKAPQPQPRIQHSTSQTPPPPKSPSPPPQPKPRGPIRVPDLPTPPGAEEFGPGRGRFAGEA